MEFGVAEELYLSLTEPQPRIADYHLIALQIKGAGIQERPPGRILRISGPTREEWSDKRRLLTEKLQKWSNLREARAISNATKYTHVLTNILLEVP